MKASPPFPGMLAFTSSPGHGPPPMACGTGSPDWLDMSHQGPNCGKRPLTQPELVLEPPKEPGEASANKEQRGILSAPGEGMGISSWG